MAKQKLDPATWAHLIRMMIFLLQMILGGIDPQKLEKRVKEMKNETAPSAIINYPTQKHYNPMAKQKLDPATWGTIIRMMIYLLQMILGGIDPQKLEKRVKEMEV